MNYTNVFFIIVMATSLHLFSMQKDFQEIKLRGDDNNTYAIEDSIHIIEELVPQNIVMDYDQPVIVESKEILRRKKKCWPYKVCPEPYKKWSLIDRWNVAVYPVSCLGGSLVGREIAVWLGLCCWRETIAQAHRFAWCSKDTWFSCYCDSARERCGSIAINGVTGLQLGSALTALCIFAPWFKEGSLNCCERVPDEDGCR